MINFDTLEQLQVATADVAGTTLVTLYVPSGTSS